MPQISEEYICKKIGLGIEEFRKNITATLPHMEYEFLGGLEKNKLIFAIAKDIIDSNFRIVGQNDSTVWQKGWGEVFESVKDKENLDLNSLKPQYVNKHSLLRIDGEYAISKSEDLMFNYDLILRKAIFFKYLSGAKKIVEFGCGTGTSQMILIELFRNSEVKLHATDWSLPALKIVDRISEKFKYPVTTSPFNMLDLEGWDKIKIDNETAILTVHAMEQLGSGFEKMLQKILAKKPKFCLHIEPMDEIYDTSKLNDYLAHSYHMKRNYLNGFFTRIKQLESEGRAKIHEYKRLQFGDRFHETYNILKWEAL